MPRIYVEFSRLKQAGAGLKTVSGKIDGIRSDFRRTVNQLDWDVKYAADISSTSNRLAGKLERYSQALKSYSAFAADAHGKYAKLESERFGADVGGKSTAPAQKRKSLLEDFGNWFYDAGKNAVNWTIDNFSSLVDIGEGVVFLAFGFAAITTPAGWPVGVISILTGINKVVGGITDIADGDEGSGKDFSDGLGWLVGQGAKAFGGDRSSGEFWGGLAGEFLETAGEAVSSVSIAQFSRMKKGATFVDRLIKPGKKIFDVADVAGDYIEGDFVTGTTGLIFELLPGPKIDGRPTLNIWTDYMQERIIDNAGKKTIEKTIKYTLRPEPVYAPVF